MNSILRHSTAFLYLIVTIGAASSAEPPKTPPDLTQNQDVDRTRTYNLGATGLRGWIYTKPAT